MAWRRIVIRPDSIIRWWTLAQLDCVEGFTAVHDSPHLREIDFNTLLAISDGSEHVRIEEMASFGKGLIRASAEYPPLFQEIGRYYERLIGRWLRYSDRLYKMDFSEKSNAELGRYLLRWIDYYKAFSPILFVPFIVERRYADEYPALLDKLAETVLRTAQARLTDGSLGLLERVGALNVADTSASLRDTLRGVLEHSPRRTVAEEKEMSLQRLAAAIESDMRARPLFEGANPPSGQAVAERVPEIYKGLRATLQEYRWLAHWGYPPRFVDSTEDEFLADLHARIRRGAVAALEITEMREAQARSDHRALVRTVDLEPGERQLLEDINYYNFLRTSRMEAKIRAQYLSIPLFREIEQRAITAGKLDRDDIFLMVPPETLTFLRTGDVPDDIRERRDGWILLTHAERGEWSVFSGAARQEFADRFYSVIDWRENARGLHNPTTPFVGGKGAGLFRLTEAGCDVPPFFVVTAAAYRRFLEHNQLQPRLTEMLAEAAGSHELDTEIAARCKDAILSAEVPAGTMAAVNDLLPQLGVERVAVRSSATVEDSDDHSWAGRFDSVLDVASKDLEDAIKRVWASLFTPRALAYARERTVSLSETPMAVVVQAMVPAEVAGVMNTVLNEGATNVVEIEAALGYGAPVVDGEITPDRYLVDVNGEPTIIERHVAAQTRMMTRDGWRDVSAGDGRQPKLADKTILELAELGKRIETNLGGPQDVEFAVVSGRVSVVQSRPLTGLAVAAPSPGSNGTGTLPAGARLVATGLKGKRADMWRGKCQVLTELYQAKDFIDGNILVLTAATPAWDPIVFRASALVTNDGGATSHAIRVANERGIPAVVGTNSATETIPDGAELVMDTLSDPFKGRVYVLS